MSYVKPKLKNNSLFPVEVFPNAIRESLEYLAELKSIPIDLLAGAALFTIASLSGNIYLANVNGGVKAILYMMMVAPSGVGKTPALNLTCGDIIAQLRGILADRYKNDLASWKVRKQAANHAKREFTEPQPCKRVRILEDATLEAIVKHSETSPAGLGVVYDEGARVFSSINQFKKESSTIDFWNENWNGRPYESVRVDSEKDRFVKSLATSLMIGMQTERMSKYFTEDVLHSGFANRFLICQGDYKHINEAADFFAEAKKEMCQQWQELVRGLFRKGVELAADQDPIPVTFTLDAQILYNRVMGDIATDHNKMIQGLKKADDNIPLIAANAKLQAYVARLALVLSIIDNYTGPTITAKNVEDAYTLYKFFKQNSKKLLLSLNSTAATGLTETETELLEALPDRDFTAKEAEQVCDSLKLSAKFFLMAFKRKYAKDGSKTLKKGSMKKFDEVTAVTTSNKICYHAKSILAWLSRQGNKVTDFL